MPVAVEAKIGLIVIISKLPLPRLFLAAKSVFPFLFLVTYLTLGCDESIEIVKNVNHLGRLISDFVS